MLKRLLNFIHPLRKQKDLMYVSFGNLFYAGFGALLWFFLATQMPANLYGSLNYSISIAAIFTAIGLMGFDSTLTTFLAKGVKKIGIESAYLVLLAGIALSIFLQIVFDSLSLNLAFLGMLFFSLSTAELLGRHKYKEFMYVMVAERTISLFSVPILFWAFGVEGALYGYAISYLPLCYRFVLSLNRFNFRFSTVLRYRNFFFHSYGLGLSKTFVYMSDKLLIMPIFGLYILGQYQFGIQMLTALSMIPLILYNYLLPQYAGDTNRNLRKLESAGILVSIMLTIVTMAIVPSLIDFLFPLFKEAIIPTQVVVLAGIPLTITAICNSSLMAREKSSYVMLAALIFLSIQYSLLLVLGNIYGLLGLSFATLIAATIHSGFLYMMRMKIGKS